MEVSRVPPPPSSEVKTPVTRKWGYTQSKLNKFKYVWTIDDFNFCGEETGEFLTSPQFSAGPNDEFKWCLGMNPRGRFEDYKDYVSVWLRLVSKTDNESKVMGRIKFSILNAKGEQTNIRSPPKVQQMIPSKENGYRRLVHRDFLFDEKNCLLPEGKLTIVCEVSFVAGSVNISGEFKDVQFKIPECTFFNDFGNLLFNEKFSDVTLAVQGREIRAHKAVLVARSDVFAAMFEHNTADDEKLSRVNIPDVSPEVLEEMLRFIYTGKAQQLERIARDLLTAADRYLLKELKVECEKILLSSLCVGNAAETLISAHLHSSDQLKTQTMGFIKTHLTDVVNTSEWQDMIATPSHSKLVADIIQALAAQSLQENTSTYGIGNTRRKTTTHMKNSKSLESSSNINVRVAQDFKEYGYLILAYTLD